MGYGTDARRFFEGGIEHPAGVLSKLSGDLSAHGPESAFLLERQLTLKPGESRTLYFLYGYLPSGFGADALIAKYAADPATQWSRSSAHWKPDAPLFRIPSHPWVEREALWSSYYLRSGFTYDSFFREHILSQGAGYQYQAGLQGAARDPLQHVLPLLFTDPQIVRQVLRYTLKEIQPDGSIPYGIVGHGVPMPCVYRPGDLQLWLLWVTSEARESISLFSICTRMHGRFTLQSNVLVPSFIRMASGSSPSSPFPEYEFNATLLGFKRTRKRYSGWYAPTTPGHWTVQVTLAEPEFDRLNHLTVNGVSVVLQKEGQSIRFSGDSASGAPLRWEIS